MGRDRSGRYLVGVTLPDGARGPEPSAGSAAPVTPMAGSVDPQFDLVREAFAANFEPCEGDPGDLGAALAVVIDGRPAVDLWGGWREPARHTPWDRDTLVNVYSVGKAVASVATLALVERGDLELDLPVATWWPELSHKGNDGTTLRQVLAHRAGLPAIREPLEDDDLFDWDRMCAALARTEPWWSPGSAHGYHTNTLGFLLGEPARRVTGRRFGATVADLVTLPAGADLHIGLPASEHHRVAEVDGASAQDGLGPDAFGQRGQREQQDALVELRYCTYFNPPGLSGFGTVNTSRWRSAEIPSTNAHGTAMGVARVFASMVGAGTGPTLLGPELLGEAVTVHSAGHDLVLDRESRFGLGMMLPQDGRPMGLGPSSFGHYGFGGSLGFADRDARLGFGYVINRPGDRWQVPRTRRLLAALRECL